MNLIEGQKITWTEPVFSGCWPKTKFLGERTNTGIIISDSYGKKRGQHSFLIKIINSSGADPLISSSSYRRLGRNLYRTVFIIEQPANLPELEREKKIRALEAKKTKYMIWLNEAENEGKIWKLDKIPREFLDTIAGEMESLFPFCYKNTFPNS